MARAHRCRPPARGSETRHLKSRTEEANWVVVIRWATVHSGPSVSAPTVRFYSVGTELHLIGYRDGWFQVLDPVTSAARLDLREVLSSGNSRSWPGDRRLAGAAKAETR